MAGYDLSTDRLYGHITTNKGRTEFLRFVRYLRSLYPTEVRMAIVLDNFSPHTSTKTDRASPSGPRPTMWSSPTPDLFIWLNRIEAQFQALRYFALDGTDHASHAERPP